MKRTITSVLSIALALIMVLSLAACGENNSSENKTENITTEVTLDKNDVANYIGTWESEHIRYTFNKGGVGTFGTKEMTPGYSFTYEVKDEVVALKIHNSDITHDAALELNDDGTALILIQNPLVLADDTTFKKVQ